MILFHCLVANGQDYVYTQLTTKDGLVAQNPNFIAQDTNGYMWFGRQNVLQRFDGHRFKNFFIGKDKIIPGNVLMGIQFDNKNRLWLLTGVQNLGYLDVNSLTYHPVNVKTPVGFETSNIALQVNQQNEVILIYVGKGFSTYNEVKNEVSTEYNKFSLPKGYEPRHVWQDEKGNFWIGSNSGLIKYSSKKNLLSYSGHNDENDPIIGQFGDRKEPCVIYVFKDRSWIVFDQYTTEIYSYDHSSGKSKEWTKILYKSIEGRYHSFYGAIEFKDGSIWLVGDGLFAQVDYEKNSINILGRNVSGPKSIWYNEVNNIFQDREKNIWVCTDRGVYRFNPSAHYFNSIPLTIPNDKRKYQNGITDVLETQNGEILVSTWGGGIFCYDQNMNPVNSSQIVRNQHNAGGMVWSMDQTKNGDIWIGYQFGMVGIFNSKTKEMVWESPKIFNGSTIRQLTKDADENIWFGTQGGHVVKWNVLSKQYSLVFKSNRIISKLLVDSKQNIWVGTDNDGVYCIDAKSEKIIHHYTDKGKRGKALLINGTPDIIQYNDTTIIIAGGGLNLLNLNTGTFTYLDEGMQISSMALDADHNLWVTTENAVVCWKLDKVPLRYAFNELHGISNFSYGVGAAMVMKNGNLLMGTNEDIQFLNPKLALETTHKTPRINVSEIWLGDRELNADSIMKDGGILHLSHSLNSLSIRYTNNQFQYLYPIYYKLEGQIDNWRMLPANGELNLYYLTPGTYIIKTASLDEKGNPFFISTLEICISSPFYKQWWFFGLVILLVLGIILWLERERMKRKEMLQNIRKNMASRLHEEVNDALNDINVLSEMAKFNAHTNPGKSIEFIEEINTHSKNMISSLDDMLWVIDPANDSMKIIIDKLEEFIRSQVNIYAKPIELKVDKNVEQLELPMKLRNEILQLVKLSIPILMKEGYDHLHYHISKEKAFLKCTLKIHGGEESIDNLNDVLISNDFDKYTESINALVKIDSHILFAQIEFKMPIRTGK